MSECTHKTLDDHSVKLRPGLRQWRCSHCERDFFWGPDASYFGAIECLTCSRQPIDVVACSAKCHKALSIKRSTP